MKLEAERIIIRPITLADKSEIFEYRSDAETNNIRDGFPKQLMR